VVDFGIFGPGVPGRLARLTPRGRRQMRFVLATHLLALQQMNAPDEVIDKTAAALRRFGGRPVDPDDPAAPRITRIE
jgi:hypothetical protein